MRWDVLERRAGSARWIPAYVQDVRSRRAVAAVAHNGGPADDVADDLARLAGGSPEWLQGIRARDYATACSATLRAITDGQLRHLGQGPLDAAVAAAADRELGDGMAWSRRESAASIAPLVAGTVAAWAFDHAPPAPPKPSLVTRRR
jgi:hypothetical protein